MVETRQKTVSSRSFKIPLCCGLCKAANTERTSVNIIALQAVPFPILFGVLFEISESWPRHVIEETLDDIE